MGLVDTLIGIPAATLYVVLLFILRLKTPKRTFSVPFPNYEDALFIKKEEWELDNVRKNQSLVFQGSASDNSSIYICVEVHNTLVTSAVHLYVNGKSLFGQFEGHFVDDSTISCGPLLLERREPFRQWRINFKGYLKNDEDDEDVFVTVGGWWKATSDANYYCNDLHSSGINAAKTLDIARNTQLLDKFLISDDINQFGLMHLELSVFGETKEYRFRGSRQRHSNDLYDSTQEFSVYLDSGDRLFYKTSDVGGHILSIRNGQLLRGDRSSSSISLNNPEDLSPDSHKLVVFEADSGSPLKLRKDRVLSQHCYVSASGKKVDLVLVKVDSVLLHGVALLRTTSEKLGLEDIEEPVLPQEVKTTRSERERSVVPLSLRSCQDKTFTGGKGANLSWLKSIEEKFTVPDAVVITTTAFERFLANNKEIKTLVKSLGASGLPLEKCLSIGEKIQSLLRAASPPEYLVEDFRHIDTNGNNNVKYAVRSSAVGEDGSELSSAGQLESCLNVTFDEIPTKVLECWASNFRHEVLTYRRTYSQPMNPSMAVVVQVMVIDGIAGVMFTCDPVKNDVGRVIINAIAGMGEDIVSGAVTPDEIIVNKKDMNINKPEKCCLSDSQTKKLVSVGVLLEKISGKPQDIEFVVKGERVYLVQSRDVTGRERESQFELMTEFDTSSLSDKEVNTTANVGEVVPAPFTPFEVSALVPCYDKVMSYCCFRDFGGSIPRHSSATFSIKHQRLFLNIGEMFGRQWQIFKMDRLAEIAIGGGHLFNDEMFEQFSRTYPPLSKTFSLYRMKVMLYAMFVTSYKRLKDVVVAREKMEALTPKVDTTFERLLELLNEQRKLNGNILEYHTDESGFSSFTYIIVGMLIRGTEHGDMSPEMISDFANVFSNNSGEVISADVPATLKKLAESIQEDGLGDQFLAQDPETALEFLKAHGKKSAKKVTEFIEVHGHRGPKELYLRSSGWGDKPEMLIATLKTMVSTKEQNGKVKAKPKTDEEIIDTLKCQPKGMRRWLMKYMVKQSHRGVASREFAKNCLVKSVYEMRQTTNMIASHLYNEGIVPNKDIVFFMTVSELETLYRTRSAKIIARAQRRKQAFSTMEQQQFGHVIYGTLEPLKPKVTEHLSTLVSLPGTVVCEGRVVAKARVAKNLDEAQLTQPGEILITKCTDICWSPFFPIISGIVTEIGGLLSHGAVVAREYGLPSLIAVQDATLVFSTGDLVELDTFKGIVSKVDSQ